jgi:nitroreductase
MMDILQMIQSRRSIREFQDRSLPEKVVDDLMEALRWAPSAGNLQSRFFYFVFNPELRKRLAEAALSQEFIARAPLVVVACADYRIADHYGQRGQELYMLQDVAASLQNLLLVAHARGLGATWVGALNEDRVRKLLNVPDHLRPVALVPVGYPDERPEAPSRISANEMGKVVR